MKKNRHNERQERFHLDNLNKEYFCQVKRELHGIYFIVAALLAGGVLLSGCSNPVSGDPADLSSSNNVLSSSSNSPKSSDGKSSTSQVVEKSSSNNVLSSSSNSSKSSNNVSSAKVVSSSSVVLPSVPPLVRATFEKSEDEFCYSWDLSSQKAGCIEPLRTSGNGSYLTVEQGEGRPVPRCGKNMLELSLSYPKYRAEVTPSKNLTMAYGAKGVKEATYIFSLYLDENFFTDSYMETLAQWHTWGYQTANGAEAWVSPDAALVRRNDSLLFIIRTTDMLATSEPGQTEVEIVTKERQYLIASNKLPKGQWNDIVLQSRWSYSSATAFHKLYINNHLVVSDQGANAVRVPTNAPPFFKSGIYNKWVGTGEQAKESYLPRKMWLDEIYTIPAIVDPKLYRSCE